MAQGRNTVTMNLDTTGLNSFLNELGDAVSESVRPAAQAGAQVFYDEVQRNVAKLGSKSGNLQKAIYQYFVKETSGDLNATYHVSWRKGRGFMDVDGKKVKLDAAPHGHLVEFGHKMPYRVVFDKRRNRFITLIRPEMIGKPKPNERNKAAMDAYYMPWPDGRPRETKPKPFLRPAYYAKQDEAYKAAADKLQQFISEKI